MATKKKKKPAPRTATKKKAVKKKPAKKPAKKAAKKATRREGRGSPPPAAKKPAKKAPAKKAKAPIVWKFKTSKSALGIYIDEHLAWIGNSNGEIFGVTHKGEVQHQYQLPSGVKCLIADDAWRYAGCDNGNIYDLTGRVPRLVYEVGKNKEILWLDIHRGNVAVSDDAGGLTVVDAEDNLKWKQSDKKDGMGWMVRVDPTGVYHGGDRGVTKYDWQGKKAWSLKTSDILFGWQTDDAVYAGTVDGEVVVASKDKGKQLVVCKVPDSTPACAASPDGKYIFASSTQQIYCFDAAGKELWHVDSGCGVAMSMQYFREHLYIVTTDGTLACIDSSPAAIARARKGVVVKSTTRKAPKVAAADTSVHDTTDASKGVVVECLKEGSKLRVRVVSPGYHDDWFCQFPKDIREAGARYVVDDVREAAQGGFYRVLGDIKRLR